MNDIDKKIGTLMKRMNWHVGAGETDKVFELVDQVHELEVLQISELPEPYRTDFLDNLEFQSFVLHNIDDPFVEAALAMAQKLSNILFRMAVIEQDDIDQADNVLQQYFYEELISGNGLGRKSWHKAEQSGSNSDNKKRPQL
jgi:hypothetical protein